MKERKKISAISAILIVFVTLLVIWILVSNLVIKDSNNEVTQSKEYNKFKDKNEFLKLLQKDSYYRNGFTDMDLGAPIASSVKEDSVEQSSEDYSDTNIQVNGVDESDNVKTDGNYIYTISDGKVVIIDAYPAKESYVYKNIEYKEEKFNIVPESFYVDDNYLVVICNKYIDYDKYGKYAVDSIYPAYTTEKVIYVYDKNNDFEELKNYTLEGSLVSSRKVDNNIYLVMNKYYNYYTIQEEENILPYYCKDGEEKQYIDYTEIIYEEDKMFSSINMIYNIDLNNLEDLDYVSTTGNSSQIYMSLDNLYIVNTEVNYINPIFEMFITSASNNSIVTKYSLNDGNLKYEASASVPGSILNQFSMDEYDNTFRIATTESKWETLTDEDGIISNNSITNNRLFVLDENLKEISKLENLGKEGETFTSCRFEEELVYLVTFEKTDPLYIINLEDKENPKIMSELQVTGYSTYQHEYDKNHLIGVGFEADEEGRTIGLKISLYDTTDKENVVEIYKEVMLYEKFGYTNSSATYNHKDFLFNKEKGIIGFPLSISNLGESYYSYVSGYMIYNIDLENGIIENGFVKHRQDKSSEEDRNYYTDYYYTSNKVKKALYMDDNLYTISNDYLVISPLDNVENYLKEVDLLN